MKLERVEQEVQKAQEALDALGITSLVYAKKDPDNGQWILCGDYKERGQLNTWTERMDRFYTDCNLFVAFFKQRVKFLLATKEEQLAFEGHPATF